MNPSVTTCLSDEARGSLLTTTSSQKKEHSGRTERSSSWAFWDDGRPSPFVVGERTRHSAFLQVCAGYAIRLGRITALQKPNGCVRRHCRRWCHSQSCHSATDSLLQSSMPPLRFSALCRTQGCRGVHRTCSRLLTDLNLRTTVLSVDGVGAFDLISRGSMLRRISAQSWEATLCFLSSSSSTVTLRRDDSGKTYEIRQVEGGEQGDPLMPFSPLHWASTPLGGRTPPFFPRRRLRRVTVGASTSCHSRSAILARLFWAHSRIRINGCEAQIWNRGGFISVRSRCFACNRPSG